MKNIFAIVGLVITAKTALALYSKYSDLKREKRQRAIDAQPQ